MNTHRSRGWRSVPTFPSLFLLFFFPFFGLLENPAAAPRCFVVLAFGAARYISMSLSAVSASFVSIALPRVSPPHLAFLAASLRLPLRRPRPRELLHERPRRHRVRAVPATHRTQSVIARRHVHHRPAPPGPRPLAPPSPDPSRPHHPHASWSPPPRSSAPSLLRARLRARRSASRGVSPLRLRDAPARRRGSPRSLRHLRDAAHPRELLQARAFDPRVRVVRDAEHHPRPRARSRRRRRAPPPRARPDLGPVEDAHDAVADVRGEAVQGVHEARLRRLQVARGERLPELGHHPRAGALVAAADVVPVDE